MHAALEQALAALLGCEAALVYSSGYLANLGAVRALAALGGPVASDAHNHASLVDGCRLAAGRAGRPAAVYRHADAQALGDALDSTDGPDRPVGPGGVAVTESVFSVHGDLAPLPALRRGSRRATRRCCWSTTRTRWACSGRRAAGLVVAAGLAGRPDVVVTATLSKALGAAGGVVAGPAAFIRHLVETSRTFIYDTGLPPAVAAGALSAVELIRGGYGEVGAGRAGRPGRAGPRGAQRGRADGRAAGRRRAGGAGGRGPTRCWPGPPDAGPGA